MKSERHGCSSLRSCLTEDTMKIRSVGSCVFRTWPIQGTKTQDVSASAAVNLTISPQLYQSLCSMSGFSLLLIKKLNKKCGNQNLGNQILRWRLLWHTIIFYNFILKDFAAEFTSLSSFSVYRPLYVFMECAIIGLLDVIICHLWFNLSVLYSVSHTEASCGQ